MGIPDVMVKRKILWNVMDTCEILENYTASLQMIKNKECCHVETMPWARSKERKLLKPPMRVRGEERKMTQARRTTCLWAKGSTNPFRGKSLNEIWVFQDTQTWGHNHRFPDTQRTNDHKQRTETIKIYSNGMWTFELSNINIKWNVSGSKKTS